MPGNKISVTYSNGVSLLESVCIYCYHGEVPGQSEFWMCLCDTSIETVFLHENDRWYYYEPGNDWVEIKGRKVAPLYRVERIGKKPLPNQAAV